MKSVLSILFLSICIGTVVTVAQDEPQPSPRPVSFSSGKRGLAMEVGFFRGVPLGELAGWTASLWFQADAESSGDLMGIVMDLKSN